jgi:hypothetical protein
MKEDLGMVGVFVLVMVMMFAIGWAALREVEMRAESRVIKRVETVNKAEAARRLHELAGQMQAYPFKGGK